MLKYGNINIGKFYYGSIEIAKAYLGSTLVFQKGGVVPPVPLPYDAEIEYLGTDGTGAYIDSGIECTGDLSIDCSVYWSTNANSALAGGIKSMGGSTYFRHHMSPSQNTLYWYQNNSSSTASIESRSGTPQGSFSHISINGTTGEWHYEGQSGTVTPLSSTLTTGKSYGILGRISDAGALQQRPARVAWFKLIRGGVLLRDFIPVRVGQVGYLYDKVSGQLFGNAGTGSFILGPDI